MDELKKAHSYDKNQNLSAGQIHKGKRELKAIQKDLQAFQTTHTRPKDISGSASAKSHGKSAAKLSITQQEDRELKKIRMLEEMFLKKEAEEERKRRLKEKRILRKQLLEVQPKGESDAHSESEAKSKTESLQVEGKSIRAHDDVERSVGRGGRRSSRGRGRGRWGKRGRGRWTHRSQRRKKQWKEHNSDSESENGSDSGVEEDSDEESDPNASFSEADSDELESESSVSEEKPKIKITQNDKHVSRNKQKKSEKSDSHSSRDKRQDGRRKRLIKIKDKENPEGETKVEEKLKKRRRNFIDNESSSADIKKPESQGQDQKSTFLSTQKLRVTKRNASEEKQAVQYSGEDKVKSLKPVVQKSDEHLLFDKKQKTQVGLKRLRKLSEDNHEVELKKLGGENPQKVQKTMDDFKQFVMTAGKNVEDVKMKEIDDLNEQKGAFAADLQAQTKDQQNKLGRTLQPLKKVVSDIVQSSEKADLQNDKKLAKPQVRPRLNSGQNQKSTTSNQLTKKIKDTNTLIKKETAKHDTDDAKNPSELTEDNLDEEESEAKRILQATKVLQQNLQRQRVQKTKEQVPLLNNKFISQKPFAQLHADLLAQYQLAGEQAQLIQNRALHQFQMFGYPHHQFQALSAIAQQAQLAASLAVNEGYQQLAAKQAYAIMLNQQFNRPSLDSNERSLLSVGANLSQDQVTASLNHLPSFNEIQSQIRRIYCKVPAEDCSKIPQSQASANIAHAPASGNQPYEGHEASKFCIVQTKANLVKELEAARDQVFRSQQAYDMFRQFNEIKDELNQQFGL